jgi:heme/copper-type cytochrome/quinol oxidase subunit 3
MTNDDRNTWWFILTMIALFLLCFAIFAYYMSRISNAA